MIPISYRLNDKAQLDLAAAISNEARAIPLRVFVAAVHDVFLDAADGTDDVGATAPAPLATPIPFGPHFSLRSTSAATGQFSSDIFSLKHESSIFRSFIQPCMWIIHDGTD